MTEKLDPLLTNQPAEDSQEESKKKPKWGKTMKVSLGVLGGLGLLMGYVSAAGMQQSEPEAGARKAIDDFFAALNARDLSAAREVLHYPHVHIVGSQMNVWNQPPDFDIDFEALADAEGWHHSTLDLCVMKQSSEDKVHFEVQYSRHRADVGRYATYQSLWIVTRREGRWGIQCRSILLT
jgi:hypothetical protein